MINLQCAQRTALPFVVALAALAGPAHAATFTSLSQARSVAMDGQLAISDLDTGTVYSDSLSPSAAAPVGDFGVFDAAVGLGALVLDTPVGTANGAGRAMQRSTLSGDAIQFDGAADVFMSGQASGNADVFGSGTARSTFDYRFEVTQAVMARLDMTSEVQATNSGYTFALRHDGGAVVWDQTVIYDDNGVEHRSFFQLLALQPGTYRLSASLSASSQFDNLQGTSGRALANFALTSAVPEPGAAGLLAVGLALLGLSRKARAG